VDKPRTYIGDDGLTHVLSDGVHDPQIVWRWRIVSDASPWKQPKGKELRWRMSEAEAASWQEKNRDTVIEKVDGSDEVRFRQDGWGSPDSRGRPGGQ
jgi:hypothetical protein